MMKPIAIHFEGEWNLIWIDYCKKNNIPHKVVCCYDSDILQKIRDCSGLMWLFHHSKPEDLLTARNILTSAQLMGLKIYPNFSTHWHFDDKVSQKYLFEALSLPSAPSWVFFQKNNALDFARRCELPIVAKLRRGAGSYNVRLLKSRRDVLQYINRMFGRGYSPAPAPLVDGFNKFRIARMGGFIGVLNRLKKAPRFFKTVLHMRKYGGREQGYCYFQKFIPNNKFDVRISIVGDHAWGFRRAVRKNDFRASGSGEIIYDPKEIPCQLVKKSFKAMRSLKMQSCAFDWVCDSNKNWYLVELSMGFLDEAVSKSPGYWDNNLKWHSNTLSPAITAIDCFLAGI